MSGQRMWEQSRRKGLYLCKNATGCKHSSCVHIKPHEWRVFWMNTEAWTESCKKVYCHFAGTVVECAKHTPDAGKKEED